MPLSACTSVTDVLRRFLSTLLRPQLMNLHILDVGMSSKCLSNRDFGYSPRGINSDSTLRAKARLLKSLSLKIRNTDLAPAVTYLQRGSERFCV